MSVTNEAKKKNDGGLFEIVSIVVQALLLALLVQMFLFQPFNIPSGSMEHTLRVGDYLFVSKWSYGYSRYSFSNKILGIDKGLIPFSGRIWGSDPQRGDIVVFRKPHEEEIDYIKRVIGLPGDKIQVRHGILYITPKGATSEVEIKRQFEREYDETVYQDSSGVDGIDKVGHQEHAIQYRETLPNGVSYDVRKMTDDGSANNTQVYEVPPGSYFMMGDNRDNSADSRFLNEVGYVPAENLIGKAQIIFFSYDAHAIQNAYTYVWQVWTWPWTVRWDRFFRIP